MSISRPTSAVYYRAELTFAVMGFMQGLSQFKAGAVLPVHKTIARSDYFNKIARGAMMKAPTDHQRSPGSSFKRTTLAIEQDTYLCTLYGLEGLVPFEDEQELAELRLRTLRAKEKTMEMLRAREVRVMGLVQNRTTWPVATNTGHDAAVAWSTHATANPIADVALAKKALNRVYGTTDDVSLLLSWRAATDAMLCEKVRSGLTGVYVDQAMQDPVLTAQTLARKLGVQDVVIGNAPYMSGGTDASPTFTNACSDAYACVFKRSDPEAFEMYGLGLTFWWTQMQETRDMGAYVEIGEYEEPQSNSTVVQVREACHEKIIDTNANYVIGTGIS